VIAEVAVIIVHGIHTYALYNDGFGPLHETTGIIFGKLLWIAPNPVYLVVPALRMMSVLPRLGPVEGEVFGAALFLFLATPLSMVIGGFSTKMRQNYGWGVALFGYAMISLITYVCTIGLVMQLQPS
jgi:hypothetical protein